MKHSWSAGSLLIVLLSMFGCGGGDLEVRLRQQREEIYTEIRNQTRTIREEMRNQTGEITNRLGKDIKEVENNLQREISDIRATHNKDNLEVNKTLMDQQKQIFNNRAILDETSRRVYFLESVITSRTSVAPQVKEAFITFVHDDEVSISIGSVNGVQAGDYFGVYKDTEKIGTIRIDTVELNSSKGTIVSKEKSISIGDKVEIERE